MNIEALAWILFFLSGVLYIVGYLPGLRAMYIDKSVEGVSQFFWELVLTTVSFSFYTLIITGADIVNIVIVGCNMFLALVMLAWKNILRYQEIGTLYTILYIVINLMVYFGFDIPLHILQSIATITIVLAYIDQIIRFAVRKTAVGTSPLLYFILGMAIWFLMFNLILTHAYIHVIITEAVNLILIMICFFMCIKYRA